jgi:ribonuclease P protein component
VLPARARVRRRAEFAVALRGRRRSSGGLVVHWGWPSDPGSSPTCVGFVVSRAVGPAVTRNRVKRRLRHLMRGRLEVLPAGVTVVIRALPASAGMSAADLGAALDRGLLPVAERSTDGGPA